MKIEIAESLFLSWLRHTRGCQLAQLNWKTSKTWTASNLPRLESLFDQSRDYFSNMHEIDLFGKNRSVSQLLQQAEIDAIGICQLEERPTVIAVDVAFHEGGLNYGPKAKTVSRVMKKIIRTVFALECYFSGYAHEIIFATPKIHNAVREPLEEAMQALEHFFESTGLSAECRVVANDDFFTEIVEPVSALSGEVADTSELFMRGMQLLGMAPGASREATGRDQTKSGDKVGEAAELPIGKLVQQEIATLLESGRLNPDQIQQLCNAEYSRETFGLRYPVLKQSMDTNERFDDTGHARYYSRIYEGGFLLCNDWYERNRERFLEWLRAVE